MAADGDTARTTDPFRAAATSPAATSPTTTPATMAATTPVAAEPAGAQPVGSLQFIGNATTLIRYGDLTLLTDPNFLHRGQRAYLGYGLTSKRLTSPALSPEQLPQLDAIVLSHLHGDHWDRRATHGLDHNLPVLTTPHAA